jgi:hypothetical protein
MWSWVPRGPKTKDNCAAEPAATDPTRHLSHFQLDDGYSVCISETSEPLHISTACRGAIAESASKNEPPGKIKISLLPVFMVLRFLQNKRACLQWNPFHYSIDPKLHMRQPNG